MSCLFSVSEQDYINWRLSQSPTDKTDFGIGTKGVNKSLGQNQIRSCRKCFYNTRDNFDMSMHRKTCKGKRHLTCSVCNKVLSRYDALCEHMRGIHGIGTKVTCRFCNKGFKYKPQVYQHQLVCPQRPLKGDFSFSCENKPVAVRPKKKANVSGSSANLLKTQMRVRQPKSKKMKSTADYGALSFPYDVNFSSSSVFNPSCNMGTNNTTTTPTVPSLSYSTHLNDNACHSSQLSSMPLEANVANTGSDGGARFPHDVKFSNTAAFASMTSSLGSNAIWNASLPDSMLYECPRNVSSGRKSQALLTVGQEWLPILV